MSQLVGGLGNDDIVKAGLTYGRIVIRIRIIMSLIVGTVLLAISIFLFSKKKHKTMYGIVQTATNNNDNCNDENNIQIGKSTWTVKVQPDDKTKTPIEGVTTQCRKNSPKNGERICVDLNTNKECEIISKNATAGIILFFSIMFYCIAFFYYYFRNSKIVAGYAAYSSVFGSRSSSSSSGEGILGRVVDDAFGY